MAGTIAMCCDNTELNNNDAQKIAQAARGIEFMLNKLYDAFETVPPPVYRAPKD